MPEEPRIIAFAPNGSHFALEKSYMFAALFLFGNSLVFDIVYWRYLTGQKWSLGTFAFIGALDATGFIGAIMQQRQDISNRIARGACKVSAHAYGAIIMLVHLAVSLFYKLHVGLRIEDTQLNWVWDTYWQNVPAELLRTRLFESVWNLHAQPPIHNFIVGILIKISPENYTEYLYYLHILLGTLITWLVFFIMLRITKRKLFSFITTLILALNPAIFLYEAYMIYTILAVALLTLCIYAIAQYSEFRRLRHIYLFFVALATLMMARSLCHIILLPVIIPIACIVVGRQWKKVLLFALIVSLLPIGWYGKNYVKFGKFSACSSGGMIFWKTASGGYTDEELQKLADDNIVEESAILKCRPILIGRGFTGFGFDKKSEVPILSGDNLNHINFPDIDSMYSNNAVRLIKHDPERYFRGVWHRYKRVFCDPSSDFGQVKHNATRIPLHVRISSQIIQGKAVMGPVRSFLFFLLPLSLILFLLYPIRMCRLSWRKWLAYLRSDITMVTIAMFVVYTTVLVCMMCRSEHMRYKFLVEQVMWVFIVVVGYRCIFRRQPRVADK